ncbi:putative bifunctional diguanylate cyclase/phosphodiesterase [Paraburkholderia diazotrophica]|uniref:PAS domain S-box-containing protein/diguanylate cyclase (GGDEF) domain-containing protein n=1 Tax=Paraburkholderia diazotrophica TaxID=667676 RepID=A0A1H6WFU6_9BURK|nr:EAL domain-containing protein [Paraburkholderia diazotrophica]SEJ15753.1 PAS domain S-box-containing protein/diguanylate cyclase (GGDEF) domain-containing protein [Paraburkholderia diazotrophica]
MSRQVTADIATDKPSECTRYQPDLAAGVLASEQTVLRLLTRSTPLPELLAEVCRRAETLLGVGASCSILVLDSDGATVRVGAAPSLPAQFSASIDGATIGPATGSCGTAMFERRLVVVDDIERDPLWASYRHLALPFGLRACWSIPFEDDAGHVLGAFAVYYRDVRRPNESEQELLREIGNSVGLAVHQDAIRKRLAQSEEHHRLVVDHLNEGIIVQSRDGIVLACNPSARRMLRTTDDVIGQGIYTVMRAAYWEDGSHVEPGDRPTERVLRSGKPLVGVTLRLDLTCGETIWVTENLVPIVKPGETEPGAVLVSFNDISAVRAARAQLQQLATRDSLTGLYNRAYLADRMSERLAPREISAGHVPEPSLPQPAVSKLAVLFVDLDGFKKVNDIAGHEAGDALLRSVAERLSACVRSEDTLARVGGDEFVIVTGDYADASFLTALAQRVLDTIAQPFAVGANEYYLGASIGISLFPDDGHDAPTLMRNADSAMYDAKQRGRNNFQFFTVELSQRLQRRFAIEQSLRRALLADELSLAYQPIVEGATGRIVGAEALLRWHNGELGHVSPAEFIPVAEDTGLIVEIGRWVLENACRQAVEWRGTLIPHLMIAVNLSPRQISGELIDHVGSSLERAGLDPSALELEITEGVLMSDTDTVMPLLSALARMGVRISVDDFGTGYSSLSYLKRFPLHCLKVDRSFVAGLPAHRDAVAITHAVVAMAHSLGMNVTAEGVETDEQAAFLRSIGCERQQGYLFGRPAAADEFAREARRWRAEI